jgi:type 1 glutamine amidotransferase
MKRLIVRFFILRQDPMKESFHFAARRGCGVRREPGSLLPSVPKGAGVKMLLRRVCCLAVAALSLLTHDNACAADPVPNSGAVPAPAVDARKKILFFSRCSEYEDTMVCRVNGQLSLAERIMSEMGKRNQLVFTFTKDGSVFTPENIAQYDAFCFFTSGDLTQPGGDGNPPMSSAGKAALLQAIAGGKGFVGIHSAANTFNSGAKGVDPYVEMLGGELLVRVRGMEPAHQIVADTNFPGLSAVPADFGPVDEWYALRNFSTNLHVLLIQDTTSMVRGSYYAPNFPSTWAQQYGQGRVFYTSMGHQEDVWKSPVFQQMLTGGLKWSAGLVDADVTPNVKRVTPLVITR